MAVDLITSENLSPELLRGILEAAYIDVTVDADGDMKVRDQCTCWVTPNMEYKDRIRLAAYFGFKPESSRAQRLEFCNQVNSDRALVRAIAPDEDLLVFDYYVPVDGGITPKAFVLALKFFCSIPHTAIAKSSLGEAVVK